MKFVPYHKVICSQVESPKVVHLKKEPNNFYIGRPSKFGNPYGTKLDSKAIHIVESREKAIEYHKKMIFEQLKNPTNIGLKFEDILELKGFNIGCWCSPKSCHGDILLKIANCNHEFNTTSEKNNVGNMLKKCIHCEIEIPIEK